MEIFIKVLLGQDIYPSVEEKGANFLYLVVKNHVFADGNLIEENNSMYSIDFENDIIEVPNTGDNRHTEIFALIGVLSAILFIVITVYEYKKRKNNI